MTNRFKNTLQLVSKWFSNKIRRYLLWAIVNFIIVNFSGFIAFLPFRGPISFVLNPG